MLKPRIRERVLREATPLRGEAAMSSRALANEITAAAEASSLYDRDFALWVEAQVAALRATHVGALDVENLIEELEGFTKHDERALGLQLKRITVHLLKQRHQPERSTRSWEGSIANGREEIADILEPSPSLRRSLPGLITKNYPRALAQAARDTRVPIGSLPDRPPFTLAEMLGKER